MDFVSYIGLKVHITLIDGFFWIGVVTSADTDGIVLKDIHGKKVSLSNKAVLTIREVS